MAFDVCPTSERWEEIVNIQDEKSQNRAIRRYVYELEQKVFSQERELERLKKENKKYKKNILSLKVVKDAKSEAYKECNYCWRITNKGYVVANSRNGSNKIIWLHRLIMNVNDENILVDHKDWDKSNNRKSNLRIATKSENNINIKRKINNTSGYTGVTLNKRSGKYVARISKNGKRIYIGIFDLFEDAVMARHKAELMIHNEWSGEINRKDLINIIKDTADAPDMEEAEELVVESN